MIRQMIFGYRAKLLETPRWSRMIVLSVSLVATGARPVGAGDSSTDAAINYSQGITVEVAGARYQGEMVTCMESHTEGETTGGTIGDGLWPPVPKEFPSLERGGALTIFLTPAPIGHLHVDAYPSPIPEGTHESGGVVCTNIPAGERIAWPVNLRPGRYVIVLGASWEGNRRAWRAFGIDV